MNGGSEIAMDQEDLTSEEKNKSIMVYQDMGLYNLDTIKCSLDMIVGHLLNIALTSQNYNFKNAT